MELQQRRATPLLERMGTVIAFRRPAHWLTRYERSQVRSIAAWKAARPGAYESFVRGLTRPLAENVHALLKPSVVRVFGDLLEYLNTRFARDHDLTRDANVRGAGITDIESLSQKPLEVADALADYVIADARSRAVAAGAASGFATPVALTLGIPAAFGAALRASHRVAQAYGCSGEAQADRAMVLQVLALALAVTRAERTRAMQDYRRQLEQAFVNCAFDEIIQVIIERTIVRVQLGSAVPGLGIIVSARVHGRFVERAAVCAKRVFQERWLRTRGKVDWIEPCAA